MEQITELIKFFQGITKEQIIDSCIAVFIIVIFCVFSSLLSYAIIKLFKMKEKNKQKIKNSALYKPLKASFILLGVYLGVIILNLPKDIMDILHKAFTIIIICIISKALANIFENSSTLMKKIEENDKIQKNKTLANFIGRIVKVVIYFCAGFLIILELGYDISGLVTGLGLGGVIIALAAQDFAKNLFGGIAIVLDRPFIVGDTIKVKDYEGIVEDITFRSTRIKTTDNKVIIIQNSTLSNELIVKTLPFTKRTYNFNLKLPLQTNSDTVETIINRIKFVLGNRKDITKDSIRVEFDSIKEDGININVLFSTEITEYNEYLKLITNINEMMLNIMESENIKLANPSQDIYVHN